MGMTLYGKKNTLSVTKEMLIEHGKAVVNNTEKALVVIDLPLVPMSAARNKLLKMQQQFYQIRGLMQLSWKVG